MARRLARKAGRHRAQKPARRPRRWARRACWATRPLARRPRWWARRGRQARPNRAGQTRRIAARQAAGPGALGRPVATGGAPPPSDHMPRTPRLLVGVAPSLAARQRGSWDQTPMTALALKQLPLGCCWAVHRMCRMWPLLGWGPDNVGSSFVLSSLYRDHRGRLLAGGRARAIGPITCLVE